VSDQLEQQAADAKTELDKHVVESVEWHFNPDTGCDYWLNKAKDLGFDPRQEIKCFEDIKKFPLFEDDDLRGGPVNRWIPKGLAGQPAYVFETGGTTGTPKSRVVMNDHWTDYEVFSETLSDEHFPKGANWLMLGPSGPRRLRLAVEHLCQTRGGICFCVDLDPRWVVKLLKKGKTQEAKDYAEHVIDQAITVLGAGHDIQCMFATPKLLEALAMRLIDDGTTIGEAGIKGIFCGGTELNQQWYRFCHEELLDGAYITPTYGNTLMGLACGKPFDPADNYKISYYAPQPRAVIEIVQFDDYNKPVGYGETGRVKLYTFTKELFIPGFMERDEGEREKPIPEFPWDGISGTRPFHELLKTTTVGVY
jgi:phenylacetate-coenzyme A ligase PaaK-like adenylate-forming protein